MIALVGAAVLWPGLARVDRETHVPTERLRLLQGSALFANLQSVSLERLAARMQPLTVQAGTSVVRQGEVGESVYVIAAGSLEVVADGRVVAAVTDGEYFGEIALLNTTARTATVVARTDARLYVLDGLDFLSAVGGHPVTSAVVRSTADQRLLELARATPRDP